MKISLRYIKMDLVMQLFLLGLNLILIGVGVFSFSFLFFALYLQFFIGAYQMLLSALPHILLKKTIAPSLYSFRQYHFFGSLAYITFLLLVMPSGWFGVFLGVGIPQILAYAYLYLTYLDHKSRIDYLENRSTILAY
jgi:hypothetical protein